MIKNPGIPTPNWLESLPSTQRGMVFMLISVVCFSLMNLVVKYLPHIPATELVLFRSIVSIALSLWMIRQRNLNPFGNNKFWLIQRGVYGVIALTSFFYTLQKMPIGPALTIQYLSPIFTAIFAIFILKERMRPVQWIYFLVAFAGIALIKGFDSQTSMLLVGLGITSAIFSGLAYNAIRKLKDSDHPVVVVFYFPLIATPIMAIVSIFHWVTPIGWDWLLLVLMGVLTQIAQVNMTKAYQAAPVGKVAPLKYIGVLLAIGFDISLFAVHYEWFTLVGMAMVVAGVVLNMLHKSSPKPIS
jgi:drug/metabolite transporter (DMT)-like permease